MSLVCGIPCAHMRHKSGRRLCIHQNTHRPQLKHTKHHSASVENWRANIPDEPFPKRARERTSSRHHTGIQVTSSVAADCEQLPRRHQRHSTTQPVKRGLSILNPWIVADARGLCDAAQRRPSHGRSYNPLGP